MAKVRITAALMSDNDVSLLGNASVVSQTGAIVTADIEDSDLRRLSASGLCVLTVEQTSAASIESAINELHLAPPSLRRPPRTFVRPSGGKQFRFDVAAAEVLGGATSDIRIVEFDHVLGEHDYTSLSEAGLQPLERVAPRVSTVRVDTPDISLTDLPAVTSERAYSVLDTINPDLLQADLSPKDVVVEAFLQPWGRDEPDTRAAVLADLITESAVSVIGMSPNKIRFTISRGDPMLLDLAAMPEIRNIDEYIQPTLANDHTSHLVGLVTTANPDGSGSMRTLPWTGLGQIVGMADSGIDRDHPDFAGRIEKVLLATAQAKGTDCAGHGTHVAGSIAGAGVTIQGMAPGARLVVQSLLQANGKIDVPVDLGDLFTQAKAEGAHIHNNSWSIKAASAYREASRELDDWAYANPDVLLVVAAGNDGTAAGTPNRAAGRVDLLSASAPGTAKNALTVGACRTDRVVTPAETWRAYAERARTPSAFRADPIGSELVAGDAEQMAAFSGRGPCDDTIRFKPDVVAPGTFILSTRSKDAPDNAFWRTHTDPHYAYLGGSSMSCAIVSGLAALVRQYYTDERAHTPSAALLKATLINGTRWLTGSDANADHASAPNYHQGFGCVDVSGSVPVPDHPSSPKNLAFCDVWHDPDQRFTRFGDFLDYRIRCRAGDLRICLVWTDPPGRSIQFPISMIVEVDGQRWYGNQDRPGAVNGIARGDMNNNAQIVRIPDADAGNYHIRLITSVDVETAFSTPSFALVVTGDLDSELRPQ